MEARRATLEEIATLREQLQAAARCQIVRWTNLPRGFAYAVAVEEGAQMFGYGAIRTTDDEDTLIEFFASEGTDRIAAARAILEFSGAPRIESQSNLPWMEEVLGKLAYDPTPGPILFADGEATHLRVWGATFRAVKGSDRIFPHQSEPVGDWCIEMDAQVVATGGFFTHYNPPYADLYMEVMPQYRRRGIGSILIQELRAEVRRRGLIPAARCNVDNVASAKCLQRGGMVVCGKLTSARVRL